MLDNKSLALFIIYIGYVSSEYKLYSGGWIPVPREQIYNQIRRESEPNLIYPTLESETDDLESMEIYQTENEPYLADINNIILEKVNKKLSATLNKYETYENNILKDDVTDLQRKAKKLIYPNLHSLETFEKLKNKDEIKNNVDKATVIEDRSVSYSVTEDIDEAEEPERKNNDKNLRYNTTTEIENDNYISKLINILSKYNIKIDDNLENYDLSRKVKIPNPTIPFSRDFIPYRYNNLNHLPVDPLLGVFLSNYGFYLPSLYGMKSNYNNLYGYLASNNIHNNRPFGLYKIFSDRDSWN